MREGSLEAPTRHPIAWKTEAFWNKDALNDELARVYDICHGCRRCVSLCDSFPTLFDLIDESASPKRITSRSSISATCVTCVT